MSRLTPTTLDGAPQPSAEAPEDRLGASSRRHDRFADLNHRDAVRARDFLNTAIDHGWSAAWQALTATSGAPYVSITAKRGDEEIRATWHTHKTGTWRWDGALIRGRATAWHHASSQTAAFKALEPPRDED